jgi:dUTP pyrophosphatase
MHDEVLIHRLDPELPLPSYARPGDAGFDLYARVNAEIPSGGRQLVPTGIAIALPAGFVALAVPRSGFALKQGGTLLNSPGVIDAGYRGEIGSIVHNTDAATLHINRGDRIAQLLILRMPSVVLTEVETLPGTQRADGGFGSTGNG